MILRLMHTLTHSRLEIDSYVQVDGRASFSTSNRKRCDRRQPERKATTHATSRSTKSSCHADSDVDDPEEDHAPLDQKSSRRGQPKAKPATVIDDNGDWETELQEV